MRCPYCRNDDTQVRDSRPVEDNAATRRRRLCPECDARFTTYERVQLRDLAVVKRSGRRQPFVREKLERAAMIALRKRDVAAEEVERMISGVVSQLEGSGAVSVPAERVGQLMMEGLRRLDKVAYVRFASVYRDFRNPEDFRRFVRELEDADSAAP